MQSERPHRQAEVEHFIVDVLSHGRVMTTQEVTKAVKAKIDLAPADLRRSNERPNEIKIDQIIANALQERRNLCRAGLIERVNAGHFRVTTKGREHLREHEAMVIEGTAMLNELFPNLK